MCQLQPLIERLEPMNNEAYPALDPQQVAEALSFACEAATEAGTIALSYFRRALNVDNKLDDGRFDPVTQADREVESFLRDKLGRRFPEFGIIGEEEGVKPGRSNVNWVIDPIDGTKAFISGFPTWGILLGLQQGARALAGLMYQALGLLGLRFDAFELAETNFTGFVAYAVLAIGGIEELACELLHHGFLVTAFGEADQPPDL